MMSKYDAETKTWNVPKDPHPYSMDVTFGEILLKNLSKNPGRILQIFADDDTELTSAQLRIASIRVAQHLHKFGIREDDVVGLITHHSHFATAFIYGCILFGCVINPLDALMDEEDIKHLYGNTKPKLIVYNVADIPKLRSSLKNVDFPFKLYPTSDAKSLLDPTGDEESFQRVWLPNQNLTITYGMTEVGRATISKPLDYLQGLSVGSFILFNISLKIIDDDGNALDNGKPGEICVRSTIKLLGYYNNPEATNQLINADGFVRTGDIGYFNDDGMLFVVDRKKDILKYKGIHLNPSEIESVIEDDFCINLIIAAVTKREGFETLTEQEIQEIFDHVASKLCDYQRRSGGVFFFEKLPTTLSDKILQSRILKEIIKLRSK